MIGLIPNKGLWHNNDENLSSPRCPHCWWPSLQMRRIHMWRSVTLSDDWKVWCGTCSYRLYMSIPFFVLHPNAAKNIPCKKNLGSNYISSLMLRVVGFFFNSFFCRKCVNVSRFGGELYQVTLEALGVSQGAFKTRCIASKQLPNGSASRTGKEI